MIPLAALTFKVSAILLLALAGALCLRPRSAAARHWVLTVGVVAACAAPAIHVLPLLPGLQAAPVGRLAWRAGPVFEALRLRPHAAPLAEPAGPGAAPQRGQGRGGWLAENGRRGAAGARAAPPSDDMGPGSAGIGIAARVRAVRAVQRRSKGGRLCAIPWSRRSRRR